MSQILDFMEAVVLSGRVTHHWKDLVDVVPKSQRSRRSDEKWPNGRSPCFRDFHAFSPVFDQLRHRPRSMLELDESLHASHVTASA